MAKSYGSNKEMLEANGMKEIARGVYVSRNEPSSKQGIAAKINTGYWKKQLQQFKAEKLAGREKSGKQ